MSDFWTQEEVEATVTDYLEMLAQELRGLPFNKAEHNRALQQKLNRRTRASIERKHQNISAILIELGYDLWAPFPLIYHITRNKLHW